jgi:AraC-like DNA-binding protein
MSSRLSTIKNWPDLAKSSGYCVKIMAGQCRVSIRQLERFFLETKGKRPHKWLSELRQQRALELLRGDTSVKETANMLGYNHPAHFSRDFKKHYGKPPLNYLHLKLDLNSQSMSRFGS